MSERINLKGVAAAVAFGIASLAPTTADAYRVGDRRRALEQLERAGAQACSNVRAVVRQYRGRERVDRLDEIDGWLRELIARRSRALGYTLTQREYANVEVLIRQCANDAGRYDDLGEGDKK